MGELIRLKMEGPVLESNIPLDVALDGLTAFQNIIDKSYLALSGGQRIGKKTEKNFVFLLIKLRKVLSMLI